MQYCDERQVSRSRSHIVGLKDFLVVDAIILGLNVFSTMTSLYARTRIHQIFGANTDVGKTVLTTALVRASLAAGRRVFYLKPVSTGPMDEADDLCVQ